MDTMKNWFVVQCCHHPHSCKRSFFASLIERERLRNVEKWKTLVQGVQNEYCFLLLNMHIFEVVVDVVILVAWARRPVWLLVWLLNLSRNTSECFDFDPSFRAPLSSIGRRATCHFWYTMASWAFIPSPGCQSRRVVLPSRLPLWWRFFHTCP